MLKEYSFSSKEVVEELKNDEVVALPTDTVYGLAIKYDSLKAYKKLIALKGRDPLKPISVMFASNYNYNNLLYVDFKAKKVIDKFLPGALTIILKAKEDSPYQLHLNTYKIGFRITADKDLDYFLKKLDFPLQVTSANLSGEKTLYTSNDVIATFKDDENLSSIIVGECKSKIATTVVDLSEGIVDILREGEISKEEIEEVYYS